MASEDNERAEPKDVPLTSEDLVPDRALKPDDKDAFNHTKIANRVADLVACGDPPYNIVLFGPWGSGKSSLNDRRPHGFRLREKRKPGGVRIAQSKQLFSGHYETVFEPRNPREDPRATSPLASSELILSPRGPAFTRSEARGYPFASLPLVVKRRPLDGAPRMAALGE